MPRSARIMSRYTSAGIAVAILITSFAAVQAQSGHANHGTPPSEKPVTLLTGLGSWKHPIATTSPEAQKYFDQGLALLYGFNRYEALRSFRKAAELDPKAPMAQWGVAASLGPYVNQDGDPSYNIKESCDAANAGLKLEANAIERVWLEAAAARCPDYADPQKYVVAMRALAARFPDDPDAQTLFAESLMIPVRWKWYFGGKPAVGVEEAERVLQSVLRRYPQHAGANHYFIHAVESSPTPERAVPSAQRLMGITPAMGHMVHMPGHIWLVLGDFNNAVAVNERAIEDDRKYFAQTGIVGSYAMYYVHNLDFLMYARSMQGRVADTMKAGKDMLDGISPMRGEPGMDEMADVFSSVVTFAYIRVQRWEDVQAIAQPKSQMGIALWHYTRALALAGKHDFPAAQKEQSEFEKGAKGLNRETQWGVNLLGPVLDMAMVALAARLEPSPVKAVPLWKRAVELQDGLTYDEPPAWFYPMRESWGAAALLSGDAAGAEAVFREGLRRSPNNGRMLFGLLESLKAQKKSDAAAWVEREFTKAWAGADVKLSLKDL
jgi:tetratricopeptide (TPR) repeat protein